MDKIKSVSDFLDKLNSLDNELNSFNKEKNPIRYFRGHPKESYKLEPSIYRDIGLIKNEHNIIRDALTYCPNDFGLTDTNFEKLVKLQHYGYPTRLLDLTSNALVALYFAVKPEENKQYTTENKEEDKTDGEVIVFDIPEEEVKYEDSDKVSILSALAFHDSNFEKLDDIIKKCEEHKKSYVEITLNTPLPKKGWEGTKENLEILRDFAIAGVAEAIELTNDLVEKYLAPIEVKRLFNNFNEIRRLLHIIRADKSYFLPIINYEDLKKVIAVRAKLNNPRIERQHGSFLIFGIGSKKTEQAELPDTWWISKKDDENRLIIDAKSKGKILSELSHLGVSKQSLFPELEAQADHIKGRYQTDKQA